MSDKTSQPTILVKKTDGTTVRMTFEQFKKYKEEKKSGIQAKEVGEDGRQSSKNKELKLADETKEEPSGPTELDRKPDIEKISNKKDDFELEHEFGEEVEILSIEDVVEETPKELKKKIEKNNNQLAEVSTPHELAVSAPVRDLFLDEAAALGKRIMDWDKEDHTSPLEEPLPEMGENKRQEGIVNHDVFVDKVLQASHVSFPQSLSSRAHSLIISWKKGVRNDHQFSTYAKKPVKTGGLGMEEAQVQKLLKTMQNNSGEDKRRPSKKEKILSSRMVSLTPIPKPPIQKSKMPGFGEADMGSISKLNRQMAQAKMSSQNILHDVTPPFKKEEEKKTTGPEQEMRDFTIVDFRRLSNDPKKSAEVLLEKFNGWKEESLLLFMEAKDAWNNSPLYRKYIDIIETSINQSTKVRETLLHQSAEQNSLREIEFLALVNMNKHLTT